MTEQATLLFRQSSGQTCIEVKQLQGIRSLYFDDIEQSRIDINQPQVLCSPLSQAFLACLLFMNTPETVLLAGLGGGELARYFHARQPAIKGVAVEINNDVAEIARKYFQFPESNWVLQTEDIRNCYGGSYDLIIVDIAQGNTTPDWLIDEAMLLQFRQQLTANGVLAINLLVNDEAMFMRSLKTLRQSFHARTLCLSMNQHKNIILFAFRQDPAFDPSQLAERVAHTGQLWQLDFTALLQQLKTDNPAGSGIF